MNRSQAALAGATLLSGVLIFIGYKWENEFAKNAGYFFAGASVVGLAITYVAPPMAGE